MFASRRLTGAAPGYLMIVIYDGTSGEWGVHSLHEKLTAASPQIPRKAAEAGLPRAVD